MEGRAWRGERGNGGGVGAVPCGGELLHAARAAEHGAHVAVRGELVEQRAELDQLAVGVVLPPRHDGHAVLRLVGEGDGRVVDEHLGCHGTRYVRHTRGWCAYGVC